MRLVLDTNVLIAAFIGRGRCKDLLEYSRRVHQLVSSAFILEELREKLLDKFRLPRPLVDETIAMMESYMELVMPEPLSEPICRDPDDDWVIATALTGGCESIVTGDQDLLALGEIHGIRIVRPADLEIVYDP